MVVKRTGGRVLPYDIEQPRGPRVGVDDARVPRKRFGRDEHCVAVVVHRDA